MKTFFALRIYRRLSLWVSGPVLLALLATSLLPVVRRYTVLNRGNENIYVTPLIHFRPDGGGTDDDDAPAQAAPYSVLSQYRAYQSPAWPAGQSTDLLVPAHGERTLFIDYEDLKQETGAQVLAVRTANDQLRYLPADFWERTVVDQTARLRPASASMHAAIAGRQGIKGWLGAAVLFVLVVLFPCLWFYYGVVARRIDQRSLKAKAFDK